LVQKHIKDKRHFVVDQKAGMVKEVKPLEKGGVVQDFKLNIMKDKGLGDTVARFTKATGIKKLADSIPGGCGCKNRQNILNDYFPYKQEQDG
jgi:hypothetical protein